MFRSQVSLSLEITTKVFIDVILDSHKLRRVDLTFHYEYGLFHIAIIAPVHFAIKPEII
jgi:hypothetical protein